MMRNRMLVSRDGNSFGKMGTATNKSGYYVGDIAIVSSPKLVGNVLGVVVQDQSSTNNPDRNFGIYGFENSLEDGEYEIVNRDAQFSHVESELLMSITGDELGIADLESIDECNSELIEVPFEVAIQTMQNNKKSIRCELGDEVSIYVPSPLDLLEHKASDNEGFAISVNEILNGTWYIINN